jgi:hypothetical protein
MPQWWKFPDEVWMAVFIFAAEQLKIRASRKNWLTCGELGVYTYFTFMWLSLFVQCLLAVSVQRTLRR